MSDVADTTPGAHLSRNPRAPDLRPGDAAHDVQPVVADVPAQRRGGALPLHALRACARGHVRGAPARGGAGGGAGGAAGPVRRAPGAQPAQDDGVHCRDGAGDGPGRRRACGWPRAADPRDRGGAGAADVHAARLLPPGRGAAVRPALAGERGRVRGGGAAVQRDAAVRDGADDAGSDAQHPEHARLHVQRRGARLHGRRRRGRPVGGRRRVRAGVQKVRVGVAFE